MSHKVDDDDDEIVESSRGSRSMEDEFSSRNVEMSSDSLFSRNVEISSASVAYNMSHKVDDNGEIVDSGELEREHWTDDGPRSFDDSEETTPPVEISSQTLSRDDVEISSQTLSRDDVEISSQTLSKRRRWDI